MALRRALALSPMLALIGAALVVGSLPAAAATCSATDQQSGITYSDLQAAIDAASPGDTIDVQGRCVGHFTVAKSLTLMGPAILDGNHAGTTLTVAGGTVVISRLTITNGTANGSGALGNGGGISDHASLILVRSAVSGGEAFASGGGLFVDASSEAILRASTVKGNFADGGLGGGVYSMGHVRLFDSAVSSNHSMGGGAGIYSTGRLGAFHSTVDNNGEGQSSGGGIYNSGHATIKRSTSGQGCPAW